MLRIRVAPLLPQPVTKLQRIRLADAVGRTASIPGTFIVPDNRYDAVAAACFAGDILIEEITPC
jgi:hypothetical protein